jgi:hypothetical protein
MSSSPTTTEQAIVSLTQEQLQELIRATRLDERRQMEQKVKEEEEVEEKREDEPRPRRTTKIFNMIQKGWRIKKDWKNSGELFYFMLVISAHKLLSHEGDVFTIDLLAGEKCGYHEESLKNGSQRHFLTIKRGTNKFFANYPSLYDVLKNFLGCRIVSNEETNTVEVDMEGVDREAKMEELRFFTFNSLIKLLSNNDYERTWEQHQEQLNLRKQKEEEKKEEGEEELAFDS